ncbi:MAG: FAD:protein FMN transferase [Gammaproteobacteria bacterium]
MRPAVVAFSAALVGLSACEPQDQSLVLKGKTMGTTYSVTIAEELTTQQQRALQLDIDRRLAAINASMSSYDKASELSRFNQSGKTDWIPVSADLCNVVSEALRITQLTQGAFDITVAAATNAWGFGAAVASGETPSITAGSGQIMVQASPPAIRKLQPATTIDVAAIAKGYAVDEIAALLNATGLQHYLVEIGGEIRASGERSAGGWWRIAIESPDLENGEPQYIVKLANEAVATSGDYRNFYIRDGQRFAHLIDPDTQKPVTHPLALVSVIADNAISSDALATGLMVLGPEKGFALARQQNLAALFIRRDVDGFSARMTAAFAAQLQPNQESLPVD